MIAKTKFKEKMVVSPNCEGSSFCRDCILVPVGYLVLTETPCPSSVAWCWPGYQVLQILAKLSGSVRDVLLWHFLTVELGFFVLFLNNQKQDNMTVVEALYKINNYYNIYRLRPEFWNVLVCVCMCGKHLHWLLSVICFCQIVCTSFNVFLIFERF